MQKILAIFFMGIAVAFGHSLDKNRFDVQAQVSAPAKNAIQVQSFQPMVKNAITEARMLPSGLYFVRLATKTNVSTIRVLLVK